LSRIDLIRQAGVYVFQWLLDPQPTRVQADTFELLGLSSRL